MKEKNLRTWHRSAGIILSLLMVLQAGSGLIFTVEKGLELPSATAQSHNEYHAESESMHEHGEGHGHEKEAGGGGHEHDHGAGIMGTLAAIHHGGGIAGFIYRIITGVGILWMAGTGSLIYFRIKAREKKKE